jgi:hypothetical protein
MTIKKSCAAVAVWAAIWGLAYGELPYEVEVWELERAAGGFSTLAEGISPEPKAMGGKFRGFGCGVRTPQRLAVREGQEYAISFEGLVGSPQDSFIIYIKAFDEQGRDVTMLRTPPAGGWWHSPTSGTYYQLNIKPPESGGWQTIERKIVPRPGVRSLLIEVSAWSGDNLACRDLAVRSSSI